MESEPVTGRKLLLSSDEIDKLVSALVAAQLKMPSVKKDKTNPFFKAKYADLSSVVATAEPVIGAEGLAIAQFVSNLDGKTSLKTFLLHSSGQWMGDEMILHEGKGTPQDQGSAITYARRYAYCAALGIVSDEDDDGNSASGRPVQAVPEGSPGTKERTTRVTAPRPQIVPSEGATGFAESTTKPKMNKLFAMLGGRKDITDDGRHEWASTVLSKEIESFSNLSQEDVNLLEKWIKNNPEIQYQPGEEPF